MNYIILYTLILIILLLLLIFFLNKVFRIEQYDNKKIIIHKAQIFLKDTDGFQAGFGDILKGTFSIYSISKNFNYTFYVDLTEHPIGKYIKQTIPNEYIKLPNELHEYFIQSIPSIRLNGPNELVNKVNIVMETENIGIFQTNYEPNINNELDKNDMLLLQELYKPNEYLQEKINNVKAELNLDKYLVIHIRTGDDNINKGLDSKIIKRVEDNLNKFKLSDNVLLLSDSNEIKLYLNKKNNYKILESDIIHLGYLNSDNKEQGIESTLIDFFLICGAEKIYSLSVYDWNSGFSTMASKLYDIPIEKYVI